MDLIYDWKSFQGLFQVKKRNLSSETDVGEAVYLMKEGSRVLAAFSNSFDTSSWSGRTVDEVLEESQNREIFSIEYSDVATLFEGGDLPPGPNGEPWFGFHIVDLLQNLRDRLSPKGLGQRKVRAVDPDSKNPFLLTAFQKTLKRFLPNQFGLYIQVSESGAVIRNLLVVFLKGKITAFHLADLSGMIPERRKVPLEVVKHLESKYLMNIFGVFSTASDWAAWVETDRPWRFLSGGPSGNRNGVQLIPFPWFLRLVIRYQVAIER